MYYLDSAPIIYLVEKVSPSFERASKHLRKRDILLATSLLSRLETRVKPMRDQNQLRLQEFDDFFDNGIAVEIDISRDVIDMATKLRAKYGFKAPDAIHLAAAVISNCEVFLTNGHRLDRCTEITVEVLE